MVRGKAFAKRSDLSQKKNSTYRGPVYKVEFFFWAYVISNSVVRWGMNTKSTLDWQFDIEFQGSGALSFYAPSEFSDVEYTVTSYDLGCGWEISGPGLPEHVLHSRFNILDAMMECEYYEIERSNKEDGAW